MSNNQEGSLGNCGILTQFTMLLSSTLL